MTEYVRGDIIKIVWSCDRRRRSFVQDFGEFFEHRVVAGKLLLILVLLYYKLVRVCMYCMYDVDSIYMSKRIESHEYHIILSSTASCMSKYSYRAYIS